MWGDSGIWKWSSSLPALRASGEVPNRRLESGTRQTAVKRMLAVLPCNRGHSVSVVRQWPVLSSLSFGRLLGASLFLDQCQHKKPGLNLIESLHWVPFSERPSN